MNLSSSTTALQRNHSASESPYDPEYESEQYYKHGNRLEIDEGYAESSQLAYHWKVLMLMDEADVFV